MVLTWILLGFKQSWKLLRLTSSSLVFSRWWNLPGHFQRLFTHGLEQPREAQTPQRRPQILTSCLLLSSCHTHSATYFQTRVGKIQLSAMPMLPGCPPRGSVTAQLVMTSEGTKAPDSEFFVRARQSRTIASKWKYWSSFMRPAWGVCSRG